MLLNFKFHFGFFFIQFFLKCRHFFDCLKLICLGMGHETANAEACPDDGGGGTAVATSVKRTAKELANRLEFAVSAYDPGVVLLSGSLAADAEKILPELEQRLKAIGSGDTAVRTLDTENEQESVYLKGAIAIILDHFLDECPTTKSINHPF